jgi:hypothetical protein
MRVVGRARGRQHRRRDRRSTSITGRSGTARIRRAEEDGKRGPRGEGWFSGEEPTGRERPALAAGGGGGGARGAGLLAGAGGQEET